MAGGSGSRLWPLSRQAFPKKFLTLYGESSMLQATAERLVDIEHAPAIVICGEEHRFSVAEQFRLNNIPNSGIILEPVGRNTGPAIALAAIKAVKNGEDPLLLMLAADHVIKEPGAFSDSVEQAKLHAEAGKLVTFGIVPTAAETGYGYNKRGEAQQSSGYSVADFVEKPDLSTADSYLASGAYYWNSGMFLFKASRYLAELKSHRLDIFEDCEKAMSEVESDLHFIRVNKEAFEACPDDSVDYAVMDEKRRCSTYGLWLE